MVAVVPQFDSLRSAGKTRRTSRRTVGGAAVFRIFNPDDAPIVNRRSVVPESLGTVPGAHRSTTPVRTPAETPVFSAVPAVDPRILELSAQVAAGEVRLRIPDGTAQEFAALPLRDWYDCDIYGPRTQRLKDIAAGRTKAATAEKDLSAIRVWERFTRVESWSGDWRGISIGAISDAYFAAFVGKALEHGLSAGYLGGLVNHLSWILSIARDRGILTTIPRKPSIRNCVTLSRHEDSDADELGVVYHLDGDINACLTAICRHLSPHVELQTAFVLACSCGLRPRDLFSLTWSQFAMVGSQMSIRVTPEKTRRYGKSLRLPVAAAVWRRMEQLRTAATARFWSTLEPIAAQLACAESLCFPSLVSEGNKDPEKSRAARRRNHLVLEAAEAVGFSFPARRRKPWQIARATCNERLERHRPGTGEAILGHAKNTINAKHYRQRWSEMCDAVNTVPQPAAFLEFTDTHCTEAV